MVLSLADNTSLTATAGAELQAILESCDSVRATATQYLASGGVQDDSKYIHVEQAECAHIDLQKEPADGVRLLSHAATTCVICVLHCTASQRAFIAHLDCGRSSGLSEVAAALNPMRHPDVMLVGAYKDGRGCGAEVLAGVLELLSQHATRCCVRLFCCGALNTGSDGMPLAQGLCYTTASAASYCPPPGSPPVPSAVRRQALWWAGALCGDPQHGLKHIYDSVTGTLQLPGVRLRWTWHAVMYAVTMIQKSDDEILNTCSTSPDAEMPGFASGIRAKLQWCLDHMHEGLLEVESEKLYFSHGQGWLPSTPIHYESPTIQHASSPCIQ